MCARFSSIRILQVADLLASLTCDPHILHGSCVCPPGWLGNAGWLHGTEVGFDSPSATETPAEALGSLTQAAAHSADALFQSPTHAVVNLLQSPTCDESSPPQSPSHADEVILQQEEDIPPEPPLQEAASPMLKSIPFMQPAAVSPTNPNDLSLEGWGVAGPVGNNGSGEVAAKNAEGWDEEGFDWLDSEGAGDFQL